jgi:hypothetical protein
LGDLVIGGGETDVEPVDLAEPAVLAGFVDAGEEVVADLEKAGRLGGVGPQKWAADVPLTELAWAPFEVNS